METLEPLTKLSKRERQIARKFAEGLTYREISEQLFIAPTTVRKHLSTIYRKLEVGNKASLVRLVAGVESNETRPGSDGDLPSSPQDGEKGDVHDPVIAISPATPGILPRARRLPLVTASIALIVFAVATAFSLTYASREPSDAPAVKGPMAPDNTGKPSVAVLPFDNLSDDLSQDYFVDGMTDDLITDLSKISGLFVIARNSVFSYKDQPIDNRDVARELGVRYVVEGSVRRAGGEVRINAQLIDGESGNHIWAERYDRELADIFAIQDEVISHIVDALSVRLTEAERSDVAHFPTNSLEAYDYYMRAERLAYRADPTSTANALGLYQRAVAIDPEFADAYAGYARVLVDVLTYGFFDAVPSAVARTQAYEAASRAAELDPRLARNYSVLAALQMLDKEHESAMASAQRAVDLAPNNAEAHLNLAVVQIYAGKAKDALITMDTVFSLNPKPPVHVQEYRALALYLDKQYDAALSVLPKKPSEDMSDLGLELLAIVYAQNDRKEKAWDAIQKILERWPENSIAGHKVLFDHHAKPSDLSARIEGLRLAGMPEWPHGFEGDSALRIQGEALDELANNSMWIGDRVGVGPFQLFIQADGNYIERGPGYQLTGTVSRYDDMLCLRSPALTLGREFCGLVFRNPKDSENTSHDYSYVSAHRLNTFSISN